MFGIGTTELLVVAVLALLLFSPRELPKILRSVSQFWGSIRRTADEFRDAIMQEEAVQDLKDAVDGTKAQLRDAEGAARRELMKARMEARRAENKLVKVARERERREREAAKAAIEAGDSGEGKAGSDEGEPAGTGPAPAGTVSSGSSSTAPVATSRPTVDPRHGAAASEPPPKTVDPRHAAAAEPDGTGDGGSASQGAA